MEDFPIFQKSSEQPTNSSTIVGVINATNYVDQVVTSYPVVESSTVVTAGSAGNSGTASQTVDSSKPEAGAGAKDIESKKPATTKEAPLPAPNSKGSLSIGPPDGGTNSRKPPASGKITLQPEEE